MNGQAGKGDSPRPKSISEKQYAKNYERAFGKRIPWWAKKEHQEWLDEITKEKQNADRG